MQSEILSNEVPKWDFDGMEYDDFIGREWLDHLIRIYAEVDKTEANIELERFVKVAKRVGFVGVKKMWNDHLEALASPRSAGSDLSTEFAGQPIRLNAGDWTCDDTGIRTFNYMVGEVIACRHPILPIERIVNVDTGLETMRLAFKRPDMKNWNLNLVVPKSTLASPQKIIELADRGISVTSDNAKALISFLQEIESLNYDSIPTRQAVSRLGWINDMQFSPYCGDLDFDQSSALQTQFKSVKQSGDFETWRDLIVELRRRDVVYKIMTAASFASPLMKILDALPSFVHLWSSQSSTGKTVGLMAASSIWGDPTPGAYLQSFNSTVNAMERLAEFYNSMPLVLDELQQAKDNRGQGGVNVYKLAQGSGKGRSNLRRGLDDVPTWANFILTSGESPIVDPTSGAGAMARVINIELERKLVDAEDGNRTARTLKLNHGHAGKKFVELLTDPDSGITNELILEMYTANLTALLKDSDVQDKQAVSAAVIITGDMLASQFVLQDDPLSLEELRPFLLTTTEASLTDRAYEYILDWIVQYDQRFIDGTTEHVRSGDHASHPVGEIYGIKEDERVFILGSVFDKTMREAGFNPQSVLSSWKQNSKIEHYKGRNRVEKWVSGSKSNYIALIVEREQREIADIGTAADTKIYDLTYGEI